MSFTLELDELNIEAALEAVTREAINMANGNVTEACRQLGCSKATFYRYADKYLLNIHDVRATSTCYVSNNDGTRSVADLNLLSQVMCDTNKRRGAK
jgi:ACT domain-containing protein